MTLNFRLFNCDRTFSLDKVEALIQRVAAKISREVNIEKTYFPLPSMKELCDELEKKGSHFEYAVFVVHAHESRLWINKDGNEGYSKLYRTLKRVTGDRVLIVIGGDDNYKDQEERDNSVLSRWASNKMCSQFTEDYINGVKSFIFSWEENHHPIHEEALEFYLPKKFVPRSKQLSAKVPEKEKTKNIEQAKLLEVKNQESKPVEKEKSLEKELHHPIHQEAPEFYLDPKKNGNQFVPRPKPPPTEVPENDETKNIEKAKLLELKRQELQAEETRKRLEKQLPGHDPLVSEVKKQEPQAIEKTLFEKTIPPERNESRPLPSRPETSTKGMTDPLQEEKHKIEETQAGHDQHQAQQASAISGTPDVHILPFHASPPSVDQVVNLFEHVYKELAIASKSKSSTDLQINIQDHIMKYKPQYLVLVSEFDYIEDMLSLHQQVQHYQEIVKKSSSVGIKLIFIITEDKKYKEGILCSDAVHNIFTKLNRSIPGADQPMIMSWNTTPWSSHKDTLVQLLTPYGKVRSAPQQYGATKQDPTSGVPYTQPEYVPMKRVFYRASISHGRVVEVLLSDPPGWVPDTRYLNGLLMKHKSVKKATVKFWDEGDGRLHSAVHPNEVKLYKIAEGLATDKVHSILVYSYHVEEKTNEEVSKSIHDLSVNELIPYQPIEPASLMTDIMSAKPDYVMFSGDMDALKHDEEVKRVIRKHGAQIREVIENCVGKGVIIMLFGDKYYKDGEELASKEAEQYVRMMTQDIIRPDRLTVLTCQDRLYTTHQDWMKELLNSKEKTPLPSQGAVSSVPSWMHYYKAVIKSGQITEVKEHIPPDWKPDEGMVRKVLEENKQEKKAYLEIFGNEQGEIMSIAVEKESIAAFCYRKMIPNPSSWFSRSDKHSDDGHYA